MKLFSCIGRGLFDIPIMTYYGQGSRLLFRTKVPIENSFLCHEEYVHTSFNYNVMSWVPK